MRLLHTGDLHLGGFWQGQSRRKDNERVLDEILEICEQRQVDVLLIAGDVLADRVEGSSAEVIRRLLERLREGLSRGRAVFLLRGNHDPRDLFDLANLLVSELAGGKHWPLVVASRPGVYRVPGHRLGVVALPYLSPGWLMNRGAEFAESPEEQVAGLAGRLAQLVEWLSGQAARAQSSDRIPLVFAGHVLVKGAKLTDSLGFETGYHRDLWLEPGRLPQYTSYNALGHIHLYQEVANAGKPSWYAGSPDRVDQGERGYTPHVLLVTVPDEPGGVALVEPLPLQTCTPFVFEDLSGVAAVDAFCSQVAGTDPLGIVNICGVPVASRGLVEAQVRQAAERVRVQWPLDQASLSRPRGVQADFRDAPATFRAYLAAALPDDQARRDKLEQAFATVWSEIVEGGR